MGGTVRGGKFYFLTMEPRIVEFDLTTHTVTSTSFANSLRNGKYYT